MKFPERAEICERCSRLCFRPTHLEVAAPNGLRWIIICHDCFDSAIRRSGGRTIEQIDGHLTVMFPTGPIVQADL